MEGQGDSARRLPSVLFCRPRLLSWQINESAYRLDRPHQGRPEQRREGRLTNSLSCRQLLPVTDCLSPISARGEVKLVVMREEATKMLALDTYWRDDKLWQMSSVVDEYPNYTVAVNGNFVYDRRPIGGGKEMTCRCWGRLISGEYNANVSSDAGSKWAHPATSSFISMPSEHHFEIAKGRPPLSPLPAQALGGLHTDDNIVTPDWMIGLGEVDTDHRVLFVATVVAGGLGVSPAFIADARKTGLPALPGGADGEVTLVRGDGGTSRALAYMSPDDELQVSYAGWKHRLPPALGVYCINTYLLFQCDRPRQ